MLELKSTITGMKKSAFMGSLVDLTHSGKESVNLKTGQKKLSRWKWKEQKKEEDRSPDAQEQGGTCVWSEYEERIGQDKYLK